MRAGLFYSSIFSSGCYQLIDADAMFCDFSLLYITIGKYLLVCVSHLHLINQLVSIRTPGPFFTEAHQCYFSSKATTSELNRRELLCVCFSKFPSNYSSMILQFLHQNTSIPSPFRLQHTRCHFRFLMTKCKKKVTKQMIIKKTNRLKTSAYFSCPRKVFQS